MKDKEARCIVIDKPKDKLIKKAFELYATGENPLSEIRRKINIEGLVGKKRKALSVTNYQYMLKNPIYCGVIRYGGELYDGKHEPIITKKLFDTAQEVMKRKSKPKGRTLKPYLYRGFFRCDECGCFVTTETQKGHNYLRCTKRKSLVPRDTLEKKSSLHKYEKKSKKFLYLPLGWMRAYKNKKRNARRKNKWKALLS